MKKVLLSLTAFAVSLTLSAQVDTLTEFFTGTPQIYGVSGQPGYLSGNNGYGDLGKYQRFDAAYGLSGNGSLTGVLLWVPVKADNGGSFDVDVINFAGGVAGSVLASATVNLADVDTSIFTGYAVAEGTVAYNVAVNFATPVAFTSTSDFLVGVTLPTTSGDTVAVVSNTDGDFPAANTHTWELWSDNSWNDMNTAWSGIEIALGIFPVIDMTAGLTESSIEANAYPNPANSELTVSVKGNATSVSVISMDGKVVATQDFVGASTTVNVSELIAGVYFYEVTAEDGSVVRNTFVKK